MTVPHPIPYQGSKRNLASRIIQYFPDDVDLLVEPFAGSAAVSLAAAYYNKAQRFSLNDLNEPLIDLWRSIVNEPVRLAKMYERLWRAQIGRERRFYDLVRDRFNCTHRPYYLLYLLARCVKAAVRYNAYGEFNQSPDNRRKGRLPQNMRFDIVAASNLLRGRVHLTAEDYRKSLKYVGVNDIAYMDPPYQGVCDSRDPRYISGIDYADFVEGLEQLNQREISFIVSYDGRTGTKTFGEPLPESLRLELIELDAGRSSQATLLGRSAKTYEALYLSPALVDRLEDRLWKAESPAKQLTLFGD